MTRTQRVALVLLATLAFAASDPARAGVIRGTVRTPGTSTPAPVMNTYPGRAGAMAGGTMPVRGRVTDAVVYLARIPAEEESTLVRSPRPRPELAQKDEAFVPRVVAIARGGLVDFPNRDPIYHNVFSLSPTRRFDLGKYRQGQSRAVRFERTGVVKVYCDIHAEMEAFVLVLANHAFAMPKADGSFELPDLPPGRYELHVWHPDFTEISRAVEIPHQGDVRLELSL